MPEQRRGLLAAHRARVAATIEELCTALAMLDHKLEHYEAAETVRTIS